MAVNMDALVRIKADVQGGNAIQAFSRDLKGLDGAAKLSSVELGRMNIAINRMARETGNTTAGLRQHISALQQLRDRVDIGGKAYSRLGTEIDQLKGKLRSLDGEAQKTSTGLGGIAKALGPLLGIFAAIQGVKLIFSSAAELESQTRSLQVLTGSAETAKKIIGELQDLGAITPFTSAELIDSAKRLQAFGVEAESVVDITKRLADVSGATGAELNGLVTAYGQVQAKGRLQGEELLQFQERGVALQEVLRKEYNLTGDEFQKALESGRISAEGVEFALKKLTDAGGKYANGAIAQSDTLNGKLSTLQDSFQRLAQNIGKFFEPTFKFLIDGINAFIERVNSSQRIQAEARAYQGANQAARDKFGLRALNPLDSEVAAYKESQRKSIFQREVRASQPVSSAAPSAPTITAPPLLPSRSGSGSGGGSGASGSGSRGGGGSARREDSLGAQIAKALKGALDLTDAQAAGIVGNFIRESGLNPRVNEGGAVGLPKRVGGYGLAQWTGSRQDDLIGFAGGASKAGDLQTQLRFTIKELLGPERGALQKLKATQTPEDAAVSFDKFYERSGVKALGERKANARNVFSEIAGSGPGAGIDDYAAMLQEQADSLQSSMKSGDDLIKQLERQVDLTLLKTDADKELQKILWDYQDRQAQINELLDQQQKTRLTELNTEVLKSEQLRLQTEELQKQNSSFFKGAGLNAETFASSGTSLFSSGSEPSAFLPSVDLLNQQQTALDGILQKYPQIGEAATAASQLVTQSVQGMITGTQSVKEAFSNFLKSIGDMLIQTAQKMITQYIAIGVAKLFAGLGGAASGGLGAAGSSAGAAAFGGSAGTGALGFQIPALFAKGGIMTGSGPMPLKRYAKGGIANSPQLAMFGEGRTPEAFVPLPDGRRIPVAMQGGGNGLREAMGSGSASAGSPVLNMSFQSTNIGGTDYVDRAQLEQAMAETRRSASRDGARRGMSMTLDKLQQSPATRSRVGMR